MIDVRGPLRAIDKLEFDVDLPPSPRWLERLDHRFNRLTEGQRVASVLLTILFLAAAAMYCLGLGSTVLVNRVEAEQAALLASIPTALPVAEPASTTAAAPSATLQALPSVIPALAPALSPVALTPVPPPIVQPIPQQPRLPAPAADVPQPPPQRPRIVAPPEPTTPSLRAVPTITRSEGGSSNAPVQPRAPVSTSVPPAATKPTAPQPAVRSTAVPARPTSTTQPSAPSRPQIGNTPVPKLVR